MEISKGILNQIQTPELLWMLRHDEGDFFSCTYSPEEDAGGDPALVVWPTIGKRKRMAMAKAGWKAIQVSFDTVMCRARSLRFNRVLVFGVELGEIEVFGVE